MTKQRNGIQKVGSNYRVRVSLRDPSLGVDPETGEFRRKVVRVGTFASLVEAQRARDSARVDSERGVLIATAPLTVEEFFERWLKIHSLTVSEGSSERYGRLVHNYIIPRLGKMPLAKIKPLHIGEFYSYLLSEGGKTGKPLSNRSVEMVKIVLKIAFQYAVNVEKVMSSNPASLVKTPKVIHKKNIPWTTDQVSIFLSYVSTHKDFKRLLAFFRLSVMTGARSGELLALEWSDFDPLEGRITISKSRGRGRKDSTSAKSTKTGRSREVYLDAPTIEILKLHKATQSEDRLRVGSQWAGLNYIFTDAWGLPMGTKTPYQIIKKVQRRLGLPEQKLHDLRAFVITELLGQGVSPHEVSDRVGAKAETLMKHYASVRPDRRKTVASEYGERMNAQLRAI